MQVIIYRWDAYDVNVRAVERGKAFKIVLGMEGDWVEMTIDRKLAEKLVRELSKRLKKKY